MKIDSLLLDGEGNAVGQFPETPIDRDSCQIDPTFLQLANDLLMQVGPSGDLELDPVYGIPILPGRQTMMKPKTIFFMISPFRK